MPGLTQLKLGLAVVGLVLFAAGVRYEHAMLRWIAIGILVAAFLVRFARRPGR